MNHVVMFSGGIGSWAAAKRVAAQHGTDNLTLLFGDTLMEDEDLYRFLDEAAANVGGRLVRLAEGRDPWQVFWDERYLGNSRIDPCSKILKRRFLRKWLRENTDPETTVVYLGVDWTEIHRLKAARERFRPWKCVAPLCDAPMWSKQQLLAQLEAENISPPRLYSLGFPHNNCGGFCVKAGQAQFKLLLEVMPERYRIHERKEEALAQHLGKRVTILRDRSGGRNTPMSLREFRERIEGKLTVDCDEWGGCGCVV